MPHQSKLIVAALLYSETTCVAAFTMRECCIGMQTDTLPANRACTTPWNVMMMKHRARRWQLTAMRTGVHGLHEGQCSECDGAGCHAAEDDPVPADHTKRTSQWHVGDPYPCSTCADGFDSGMRRDAHNLTAICNFVDLASGLWLRVAAIVVVIGRHTDRHGCSPAGHRELISKA